MREDAQDRLYIYDGTFEGALTCFFRAVRERAVPLDIVREEDAEPSLYETEYVVTDVSAAGTVRRAVIEKISPDAWDLLSTVFMSCMKHKETAMLRFLRLGFKEGAKVTGMISHPDVAPMLEAERFLMNERHLLLGFVRFSDFDGKLISVITPKNEVLPFLASHFIGRFHTEEFMIYDKNHRVALVYEKGRASMVPMDGLVLPPSQDRELTYRTLWKKFYDTIAIKERYNPKCRMTHLPRRYWENMVEMQDLL